MHSNKYHCTCGSQDLSPPKFHTSAAPRKHAPKNLVFWCTSPCWQNQPSPAIKSPEKKKKKKLLFIRHNNLHITKVQPEKNPSLRRQRLIRHQLIPLPVPHGRAEAFRLLRRMLRRLHQGIATSDFTNGRLQLAAKKNMDFNGEIVGSKSSRGDLIWLFNTWM